jgi:acyl transferase domain-containing protein/SAM-dependent methyltransferase/acyl carrier protein
MTGNATRPEVPDIRSCANGSVDAREPIAIIGIGCRFPGNANDPQSYWKLLRNGVDALTEIPPDRWDLRTYYDSEPGKTGKTNVKFGGFIKGIDQFDANFFGISPREATWMDPQQRLILEVAWETLEDGGQQLERIAGTSTGVFVGMSSFDYSLIQMGYRDRGAVDVYTNTGGALSIAANRISYCLNFTGPSAVIDTACSSALTAVYMGCNSLWKGESTLALAGGVHVLITPGPYLGFSKLAMLSADGRCKAFDARANGFVRSEGAGMVLLKPLSQARADGDRIYALVRSCAINQDGKTSGLTVPSQQAQEELVREACRQAHVPPAQIQYVESHGTGTLVGDPIEARALGAALGEGRAEDNPCIVGSVKTNIGHLEAASGIAGLIKTALALKHRQIPPNLHFEQPNPDIAFDELRLRVPTTLQPWPSTNGGAALAGVNSFGFGGSNAHVLLQEAPAADDKATRWHGDKVNGETTASPCHPVTLSPRLLPLSARSPDALKALAESYKQFLSAEGAGADVSLADLASTLRYRRSHHDHRIGIVTHSREELLEQLVAVAKAEPHPLVVSDRVSPTQKTNLAFVCSGQGPQWWAMGRQLLSQEPIFRDMIHRCDELIRGCGASWSLVQELSAEESQSRLQETAIAQPAIFAIQVALAAVWKAWGIQPDVVIGHSVGEVAAAHIAGVLSLEDAVRVIYHRGRCMDLASGGRMLAVGLSQAEGEALIGPYGDRLSLAAVNSPNSLTISGEAAALEELNAALQPRQVYCKFLHVNYAFHSAQMDPVRDELLASLEGIQARPATLPIVSTVTGGCIEGPEMGPDYWWQNVRRTVRFADGVERLLEKETNAFLEISPHPVLSSSVAETALGRSKRVKVVASLRRNEEERAQMLKSLGALYAVGRPLDWDSQQGEPGRFVRLPTYPWQHEHFWHESEESQQARLGLRDHHPLLGAPLKSPAPSWSSNLDPNWLPWLNDHKVQGAVLVPGMAYLELALAAGKEAHGTGPYVVEEIKFVKACFLPKGQARYLQTIYQPHDSSFHIHTQVQESGQPWVLHATGVVRSRQEEPPPVQFTPEQLQQRCLGEVGTADCYEALKKIGLDYGPTFQGIEHLWLGDGEALGRIAAPPEVAAELDKYHFHPALLDACLQVTLGTVSNLRRVNDTARGVYLPVEIEEVRVYARPGPRVWSHAKLTEINRQGLSAQVHVFDENGALLLEMNGLRCQYVGVDGGEAEALDDLLYEFQWQLQPRRNGAVVRRHFGYLPPLTEVAASVEAEAERLLAQNQKDRYRGLEAVQNTLCMAFVCRALQQLGADFQPGQRFTTEALANQLKVVSQHRRLFARYLGMLAEDGILRADGDAWEVVQAPNFGDPLPTWKKLLMENPAFFAELTLIGRCGKELAAVLNGSINPLQLIFPDGSLATAEHLYQDSPSVRFYNALAQHAIVKALENLPLDRPVRILEIGAGTGGLTSYVLPRLPADRTEYVFTDLSNHFFIKAGQKFADFPFVQYKKLDIEKDPLTQEFTEHSFDLVLASQVLHATTDLRQTLTNVRKLMAGDGLLVLLEVVKPSRWIDLVFGLTEGWWRFSDADLRPTYPLLSFDRWQALLADLGFHETVDVSGGAKAEGFGSAVILSRSPLAPEPVTEVAPAQAAPGAAPAAEGEAQPAPAQAPVDEPPGNWLIFADTDGLGEQLAQQLRSRGAYCSLVHAGEGYAAHDGHRYTASPPRPDDLRQLFAHLKANGWLSFRGIVHLWNLDAPAADGMSPEDLEGSVHGGSTSIIHLVQAWSEATDSASRLFLVTRGAQSVGAELEPINVTQTPVWGLARVLYNEFPKLRCKIIDLSYLPARAETGSLVEELWRPDDEDEIALRGEARYIHRYRHGSLQRHGEQSDGQAQPVAYRLEVPRFGVLDGLTLREVPRQAPAAHQVEIQVCAAALNFSDVMKALGLYPGLPDGPVPLGIECSGRISAVGEGVEGLQVGDEVVAIAPFSFGSHVITYAPFVAHKPQRITFEEAATLPIAFLTAHYAMNYLGHLEAGERILVHAASGGVGLAAIQLAHKQGAEVLATAGSPEKREFLKSLGVQHVMDSRSLAFAGQVMTHTGGRGVDVVLNSLSGEAIFKGMTTLAEYGRFLEIGKRDIYMNSKLGMKPFRKNLSFIAIDLDRAMRERPLVLARLYKEVMDGVRDGSLHPLPHRVFSITNVVAAFRYMAQAKHIGKVVISLQEQHVNVAPAVRPPIQFRADATYLITGGLGGFGLVIARWLVENGARHLVLVGRRGIHSPECEQAVETLRKLGAEVVVAQADVSQNDQVAGVLAQIAQSMPPLRGIMHAAMVLDDCLTAKMTHEHLMRVLGPRMTAAWHLHTQTLGVPLDFFVCFSSMASVFGLPGQANYCASNTFFDNFAYYRRSIGLPALTINWGHLAEVGYVARNEKVGERLEGQGLKSFSPREAVALLGRLIQDEAVQVGIVRMDWSRWSGLAAGTQISPRFTRLYKEAERNKDNQGIDGAAMRRMLLAAAPDQRKELLLNFLREKVARVLGSTPDKVDFAKPLTDLGLDSLMGVELRNWIEGELRVNLPIVELMQGPSVDRLADLLLEQLTRSDTAPPPAAPKPAQPAPPAAPVAELPLAPAGAGEAADSHKNGSANGHAPVNAAEAEQLLSRVDDLSNEEVDSLLSSMLADKESAK